MPARFTIFGASGFIGGHLSAYLKRGGHDVTAIARRKTPAKNTELGHAIFCIGLTADFRSRLVDTVRAHVCLLAEFIQDYQFESFLYLSSTRVYGGAGSGNEESSLTVRPDADHLYNLSKLTGEALCLGQSSAGFRVARLSNVIGRGSAPINFLQAVIDEARQKGTVTLQTSAESAKDYIDIDDVCRALEFIALKGRRRLYNVASSISTSNREVASCIHRHLGATVAYASGARTVTFPSIDISRLRGEFGFSPIPFEESCIKLIRS